MAVVVNYDPKGEPEITSVSGIGISDTDKERALELDKLIKKELKAMSKRMSRRKMIQKKGGKHKIRTYLEFGAVLRDVYFNSGLVDPAEQLLYWQNVKTHAPEDVQAEDRGANRIHVAYCFRLAGFAKGKAMKMKWSEWVYLFDSPGINQEERFDEWFELKMDSSEVNERKFIRLFVQCLNSVIKDIETADLTDGELTNCYEGSWSLSKRVFAQFKEELDKDTILGIKNAIAGNQLKIAALMDGEVTPEDYSEDLLQGLS